MSDTIIPKLIIAVNPTPLAKGIGGWHSVTNRATEIIGSLRNLEVIIKTDSLSHDLDSSLIHLIKQNNLSYFADLRLSRPEALELNLGLIADLEPGFVSVSYFAGTKYMAKARETLSPKTKVFGDATLGSINEAECHEIYQVGKETIVLKLVSFAIEAKLDGVICSTKHTKILREKFGGDLIPLIAVDAPTSAEALQSETDYVVITVSNLSQIGIIKNLVERIKVSVSK